MQLGVWGAISSPAARPGEGPGGGQGVEAPQRPWNFAFYGTWMSQKTTPFTREVPLTYEKRKTCSTCFHSFRQVETVNEFADFLAYTGTYA